MFLYRVKVGNQQIEGLQRLIQIQERCVWVHGSAASGFHLITGRLVNWTGRQQVAVNRNNLINERRENNYFKYAKKAIVIDMHTESVSGMLDGDSIGD